MARQQNKDVHEKHQAILSRLLKDDDNKYCVDCDAKGPRWASWNIGIFLCIRCAGIHRNLGVHISKVKSINLDSWTAEQIASVEDMGNSRARAVYEANLPDNYKRPATADSAMEQFIRAKYEHKKYIAKEWVPSKPRSVPSNYYDTEKETKKENKRNVKTVITIPGAAAGTAAAKSVSKPEKKATPVKPEERSSTQASLMVDLNSPAKQANGSSVAATKPSTSSDLLADIFSSPSPAVSSTAGSNDILGLSTESPAAAQAAASQSNGVHQSSGDAASHDLFQAADEKNQSTKDSIMALFGNMSQQPQQQANMMQNSFNMQGSYPQQQPQQQIPQQMMYNNQAMMQQQGMMGAYQQPNISQQQPTFYQNPQQGMMGNPQQGMMGNPQQGMMGMQPGYYNQQQQMYASQLQNQMANMTFSHQQQQQNIPTQAVAAGTSWGGNSAAASQTNGQTLNFDLWN